MNNIKDEERKGNLRKSLRKTGLNRFLYGVAGATLFTGFWQIVGGTVLQFLELNQFQGLLPIGAFQALYSLFFDYHFWVSVWASLNRIGIGLAIAFINGFAFGVLLGYSSVCRKLADFPLQFLRMISPLSWMPIAILLLPNLEYAIYFLISMAGVWPVLQQTTRGVLEVDNAMLNMAKIQGANRLQLFRRIVLPYAMPSILSGLRLSLGIGWIILVPAEYLGINSGLGYLINDARDTMDYDRLMAVVIAIGILGYVLDSVLGRLQRYFDWKVKS